MLGTSTLDSLVYGDTFQTGLIPTWFVDCFESILIIEFFKNSLSIKESLNSFDNISTHIYTHYDQKMWDIHYNSYGTLPYGSINNFILPSIISQDFFTVYKIVATLNFNEILNSNEFINKQNNSIKTENVFIDDGFILRASIRYILEMYNSQKDVYGGFTYGTGYINDVPKISLLDNILIQKQGVNIISCIETFSMLDFIGVFQGKVNQSQTSVPADFINLTDSIYIYHWSITPDIWIGNYACDVCGFTFKKSQLLERWDGALVCKWDYEEQHPRDYLNDRFLLEQSLK